MGRQVLGQLCRLLLALLLPMCGADRSSADSGTDTAGALSSDAGIDTAMDGGTNDDAATDSEDAFAPCPKSGDPCKILPLGDSITDGFSIPGGYRIELFLSAYNDGRNITFVGRMSNGPETVGDGIAFPQSHEGHSGWEIGQTAALLPSPGLDVEPHIVLLMIGTNDILHDLSDGAPDRFAELLDTIIDNAPNALTAVALIPPISGTYASYADAVEPYNSALAEIVGARQAAGDHVISVDQFSDFPPSESADGVHPNEAGYARMASVWYDAISDYLPAAPER